MKIFHHLLAPFCLAAALLHPAVPASGQTLRPFVLAAEPKSDALPQAVADTTAALQAQGFELVGSFAPYPDAMVLIVTSEQLKSTAAKTAFGGYGIIQRIAVTKAADRIQVSYTNPPYFAAAYRLQDDLGAVKTKLEAALGRQADFGSEKGLTAQKLSRYHYALGMERFDSLAKHLLAEFPTHAAAVSAVEAGLAAHRGGVAKIYRVDLPGKDEVVFGVSLADGKGADAYVMQRIDFATVKSTAHLPYEILVSDNKVYHLFARFRIAIDFPDLSMMGSNSFMSIMSAPGAIKEALTAVVTASPEKK